MLYELTITLRPSLYKKPFVEQHRFLRPIFDCIFERDMLKSKWKISMVLEETKAGNAHYHAIIELKDLRARQRMIDRMRPYFSHIGKYSCSQVVDYAKWVNYMKKDLQVTKETHGISAQVYDDHEIFDGIAELVEKSGSPEQRCKEESKPVVEVCPAASVKKGVGRKTASLSHDQAGQSPPATGGQVSKTPVASSWTSYDDDIDEDIDRIRWEPDSMDPLLQFQFFYI